MVADGGPLDKTSTLLAIGAVLVGLVAVQRLRERAFVSMTYGLSQRLRVSPGVHTLLAQFVAVDHAPFAPPVAARVAFDVER